MTVSRTSLTGMADRPYGVPRLNADGELVGPIIPRTGLSTDDQFMDDVGEAGELIRLSDTGELFLSDGATANKYLRGRFPGVQQWTLGAAQPISGNLVLASKAMAIASGGVYRYSGFMRATVVMAEGTINFGLIRSGQTSHPTAGLPTIMPTGSLIKSSFGYTINTVSGNAMAAYAEGGYFSLATAVSGLEYVWFNYIGTAAADYELDVAATNNGTITYCQIEKAHFRLERIG